MWTVECLYSSEMWNSSSIQFQCFSSFRSKCRWEISVWLYYMPTFVKNWAKSITILSLKMGFFFKNGPSKCFFSIFFLHRFLRRFPLSDISSSIWAAYWGVSHQIDYGLWSSYTHKIYTNFNKLNGSSTIEWIGNVCRFYFCRYFE